MLKNFKHLISKKDCNIWSDIAAAVWEKIPLVPISNGPVVIHSPINDTSTPDKEIEGLLEKVN